MYTNNCNVALLAVHVALGLGIVNNIMVFSVTIMCVYSSNNNSLSTSAKLREYCICDVSTHTCIEKTDA